MYSVTHTLGGSRLLSIGPSFDLSSRRILLVFIAHPTGMIAPKREYGIKPVQSEKTNFIDDHECFHYNFKGNLFVFDDPNFALVDSPVKTYRDSEYNLVTSTYREIRIPAPVPFVRTHLVDARSNFIIDCPPFRTKYSTYYIIDTYKVEVEAMDERFVYVRMTRKRFRSNASPQVSYLYSHTRVEVDIENWRHRTSSISLVTTKDRPAKWPTFSTWVTAATSARYTCSVDPGDTEDPIFQADYICEKIWGNQSTIATEDPSQDRFVWGDLTQVAASSARYIAVNTAMYAADFFKLGQLIRPFVNLVKGDFALKNLASAYLALHYGVSLTIRDTVEIAEAIEQLNHWCTWYPFRVARATSSVNLSYVGPIGTLTGTRKYNMKMYYNPLDDKFSRSIRHALAWDYLPTAANIWDFIPFSFVVDWFIGIEEEMTRWETSLDLIHLKVLSTLTSQRDEFHVGAEQLFSGTSTKVVTGDLSCVRYQRTILDEPPQPISRLETPSTFDHWVEGTALLIQRFL